MEQHKSMDVGLVRGFGPPLLLSPREAAKALCICEKSLWTLTKRGEIPAVRIGRSVRYSLDDLKKWIQGRSQKSALEMSD
jgi:excisionase family DNA binding protein